MRILLLGDNILQEALVAQGYEVLSCGHQPGADIQLPPRWFTIANILRRQEVAEPDLILFCTTDEARFVPVDIHAVTAPRVLWALANPGGYYRLKELAPLFDRVFVSQQDYCRRLQLDGIVTADWLPAAVAERLPVQRGTRRHRITLVVSPDGSGRRRADILQRQLGEKYPVNRYELPSDESDNANLLGFYSESEIVIHCAARNLLTTGVMQAMLCGAVVLAERSGNGIADLFQNSQHLLLYDDTNLMTKVDYILDNDTNRTLLAANAKRVVELDHSAIARAAQMTSFLHKPPSNEPLLNAGHHLGTLLMRTGMMVASPQEALGRAAAVLQEAVHSSLSPADTWLQTAICRAEAGEPYAALAAIKRARQIDPSYYHAHFIAAALYAQLFDNYNAAACYVEGARCITQDCTDSGMLLMEKAEREEFDGEFHRLLGDIYRYNGRGYIDGMVEQREPVLPLFSVHHYRLALEKDPGDYLALQALGAIFLEHNLPEQAVEAYSAAVKLAPYDPESRYDLGLARIRQMQRGEGISDLAQAFVLDGSPPRLQEIESLQLNEAVWDFFWGEVLADELKYEASEQRMLKAIGRGQRVEYFTLRLGQIYYDRGLYDEAVAAFREYLRRLPASSRAYALLGFTYLQLQQTELALWCLKRSLNFDGSNGIVKKVRDRLISVTGETR